ncbi:MAG: 50S ribosomal protein L14e [Candidatus Woesearchaeota archaeon]|nr:MAG: 50S ribosomal protein L14e [Candidatus Woesearchaeota archaeon]
MAKIGQLCVKLAGRDAGKECIIVEKLEGSFVMIDGLTRRKKCNLKHLEVLPKEAKIQKGATHEEALSALRSLGIKIKEKKKVKKEKPKKEEKKEKKPKFLKKKEPKKASNW